MKRAMATVVVFAALFAGLVLRADALDASLAGYWKCEEGQGTVAADASGHGNHGNVRGGAEWVKGPGVDSLKGCLALDGVDDYVDCGSGDSLVLNGRDFTLMAWVSVREHGQGALILSKELGGRFWPEYQLFLGAQLRVEASFWNTGTEFARRSVASRTALSVGRWHHVAATYDGSTFLVYLDGVEDGRTENLAGTPYAGTSSLFIGAAPSSGSKGLGGAFGGRIREVGVFGRCLSAGEVRHCYRASMASLEATGVPETWPGDRAEGTRRDIIVVNGVDYRAYGVHKALVNFDGGAVRYHDIVLDHGLVPRVTAHPASVITDEQLRRARLFIIVNAPAPAIAPETREALQQHVREGLNVLILGGLFSFGKGQYTGTQLEQIVPVDIKDQWSVKRLDPPLALQPGPGVLFSERIDWRRKPSTLYYHDATPKPGAEVWLKAGDIPLLVVRKLGNGCIAGFLTAPLGRPPEGALAYWEWEAWPALLAEIVEKLMYGAH